MVFQRFSLAVALTFGMGVSGRGVAGGGQSPDGQLPITDKWSCSHCGQKKLFAVLEALPA